MSLFTPFSLYLAAAQGFKKNQLSLRGEKATKQSEMNGDFQQIVI